MTDLGDDFADCGHDVIAVDGFAEVSDGWAKEEFVDGGEVAKEGELIRGGGRFGGMRHGAISTQEGNGGNCGTCQVAGGTVALGARVALLAIDAEAERS